MRTGWEGWEGENQAEERSIGGRERKGEEGERRRVEGERDRVSGRTMGSTREVVEEVLVRLKEEEVEGARKRSSRRSFSDVLGVGFEEFEVWELTRLRRLS